MFCYAQDYEPPSNVFSNFMEIEQANIKQSRIIPLTIPSMQERREVLHVTDDRQTKKEVSGNKQRTDSKQSVLFPNISL